MLTADNLFHSLIIRWTNILNQLSEITQFVTLWKTCTVWWPVLHTFPPLSQWAIFVTVWKEKLGKMLIKIWWLDIGVTYELTVCTVWCTVHSPVLEWAQSQWARETTLGFLLCTLETGPYWAWPLSCCALQTPGWVNVSDRDKVLGITVSPQQPSAQGSPASEQKVKMLNSTTKLTESFVLKLHINSQMLRKKWKNIILGSCILLKPC